MKKIITPYDTPYTKSLRDLNIKIPYGKKLSLEELNKIIPDNWKITLSKGCSLHGDVDYLIYIDKKLKYYVPYNY